MSNNYSLVTGLKKLNNKKPDHLWAACSKQQTLTYLAENSGAQSSGPVFYFNFRPTVVALVIFGVICFSGVGTIFAAQNTLPGHPLYGLKRLTERAKLVATFNTNDKNVLRAEMLNTRVEEAQVLARQVQAGADGTTEKNLVAAANNIKISIQDLRQEVSGQKANPETVQVETGSLPIQDGKEIAKTILSPEIEKTLSETKDLLAKNDFSAALIKATEASDKITVSTPDNSVIEQPNEGDSNTTSTTPIVKPSETPDASKSNKINPDDKIQTNLILEK